MFSDIVPTADNTVLYDPEGGVPGALAAALHKAHTTSAHRILFVSGLYLHDTVKDDIVVNKSAFVQLMREVSAAAVTTVSLYLLSEGKAVKNRPTPEVLSASKIELSLGTWDLDRLPPKTRVEAYVFWAVSDAPGATLALTWGSMCFPFSNFGHAPIKRTLSQLGITVDELKQRVECIIMMGATACQVDWHLVQVLLDISILTGETLINGVMKMLASLFLPAILDVQTNDHRLIYEAPKGSAGNVVPAQLSPSVRMFLDNIEKLERIELKDGEKPFRASVSLLEGGAFSFQGHGYHATPVVGSNLADLVAAANAYVYWAMQVGVLGNPNLDTKLKDKGVKGLGNALHINAVYFGQLGNGATPYPLGQLGADVGVNTLVQGAVDLLRCTTDAEFASFCTELLKLNVRIQECAAHWRGSFYYIDNTYGGAFGLQLGPYQTDVRVRGKALPFYNAMGHGFALAGETLLRKPAVEDEDIRALLFRAFERILLGRTLVQ